MATYTFLQNAVSGTDASSYTFSSQAIGTANADRIVIVSFASRTANNGPSLTSATIGGITATIVIQQFRNDSSNGNVCGIIVANVPTGTTADVVLNFSHTMLRAGISMGSSIGMRTSAFASTSAQTSDPSLNINTPANGVVVAVATGGGTGAGAWTGLTERADDAMETSSTKIYAASGDSTTAETPRTITCTISGGEAGSVGCSASFASAIKITADAATFTHTGQDATLTKTGVSYSLACDAAAFALSGQDALFLRGYVVDAAFNAFIHSGQDVLVEYGRLFASDDGTFVLTGQDATFVRGFSIVADVATFVLSGQVSLLGGVPHSYAPNNALTWVQKADYIWALHPSRYLKADKGNVHLNDISGTETQRSDNWLTVDNSRLETQSTIRFGDNSNASLNIGGVAVWVDFSTLTAPTSFQGVFGIGSATGASPDTFRLGIYSDGYFYTRLGGEDDFINAPSAFSPGRFHIVWQSYSDKTIRYWINGVEYPSSLSDAYWQANVDGETAGYLKIATLIRSVSEPIQNGAIRLFALVNDDNWSDAEVAAMYANPFAYYSIGIIADEGVFSLAGQDATFVFGYAVIADAATFVVSGQDALLSVSMVADTGAFVLAGQDATLTETVTYSLTADEAAFVLTGQDAGFVRTYAVESDAGAFVLSGQDAAFGRGYIAAVDVGAFTFTGQDVNLVHGVPGAYTLPVDAGTFLLSGNVVLLGGVPHEYAPNTSLSWVTKATEIWALHPSRPLAVDKGTHALEYFSSQTEPWTYPTEDNNDNTLHIASWDVKGAWLRTIDNITLSQTTAGMALWVNLDEDGIGDPWYTGVIGQNQGGDPPVIVVYPGLNPDFDWGTGDLYLASTFLQLNTWHFIAMQLKDGEIHAYVDGVEVDSLATSLSSSTTLDLHIGGVPDRGVDLQMHGFVRLAAVITGDTWTDAEIAAMYANSFAYYAVGLIADHRAFALSGQDTNLIYPRLIASDVGTFVLAGQDIEFLRSFATSADAGAFLFSGQDNALTVGKLLTADAGTVVLAGQDVALIPPVRFAADVGTFAVAGQDVVLRYGSNIQFGAEVGTFVHSGQDANLVYARMFTSDVGAFVFTGHDVDLARQITIASNVGTFVLAGQDIAFIRIYVNAADVGTFVFTGQDASLLSSAAFAVDAGAFVLNGQDVGLLRGVRVQSDVGIFVLDGMGVEFVRELLLDLSHGVFVLDGQDVILQKKLPVSGRGRTFFVRAENRTFVIPPDPKFGTRINA